MATKVTYFLVSPGKREKYSNICFSPLVHWAVEKDIFKIEYDLVFNVKKEIAKEFFFYMYQIGFVCGPHSVDKGIFLIALNGPGYKHSKPWILGNLTLARYTDEYPDIIENFLLIRKEFPFVPLWHLLQLAHFIRLSQKQRQHGDGHSLIPSQFPKERKLTEFKPWQLVLEDAGRAESIKSKGYPGIQRVFGPKTGLLSDDITTLGGVRRFLGNLLTGKYKNVGDNDF